MQRQGRRRFLKFVSLYSTYTTHTLINGETGDPCPPP